MFKNFRTLSQAFDDGKSWISTFRKVPAATATITGQWYDYSYASGNPIPNYYAAAPTKAAVLESDKGIIVPRMAGSEKQYLHRLTVMSNGSTAGSTGITLGVTGGISGALWTSGQADIDLGASAMLVGIGSIAGQAWFAINTRYFDLNKYQRAYVRHVLETVYALNVVEQIVSVAERHNLSAIDSVDVVRVQTGDQTLFILPSRTVTVEKPQRQTKQAAPKPVKETRVAYALTGNAPVYASSDPLRALALQSSEAIVSSYEQEMLFINNKPSRYARNAT